MRKVILLFFIYQISLLISINSSVFGQAVVDSAFKNNLKSTSSANTTFYTPGRRIIGNIEWNQYGTYDDQASCDNSYNMYAPHREWGDACDHSCEKKPIGCGAVAAGQIMRYYQWPIKSEFRTYNWSIMPDKVRSSTSSEAAKEVAHLLKDFAEKANMHYRCGGSWATLGAMRDALASFGYNGVDARKRKDWSDEAWEALIRAEIDAGRPVIYRGGDIIDFGAMGYVHYFVCDGYTSTDNNKFFYNFGYGRLGSYDNLAYSTLDDIQVYDPDNPDGFNRNQMAIIGISPSYGNPCPFAQNIYDVNYTSVTGTKEERAVYLINLPQTGKSLNVENTGDFTLIAGEKITLNKGFIAKRGGHFHAYIKKPECNEDCGIKLVAINNALIKGDPTNGSLVLIAENANSYEIVVQEVHTQGIVYTGAGSLVENQVTTVWKGEGSLDLDDVYLASIIIRNNCGEKYLKQQDVTVLIGGEKSSSANTSLIFSYDIETGFYDRSELQENLEFDYKVYPNPNNGSFSLTFINDIPDVVLIYTIEGRLIRQYDDIKSSTLDINLINQKGVYIVKLITKGKLYNKKITIL